MPMFKKREMVVQVRKKNETKDETIVVDENRMSEKLLKLLPKILIGGVVAVYGYVLLDAACQIAVDSNKQ